MQPLIVKPTTFLIDSSPKKTEGIELCVGIVLRATKNEVTGLYHPHGVDFMRGEYGCGIKRFVNRYLVETKLDRKQVTVDVIGGDFDRLIALGEGRFTLREYRHNQLAFAFMQSQGFGSVRSHIGNTSCTKNVTILNPQTVKVFQRAQRMPFNDVYLHSIREL